MKKKLPGFLFFLVIAAFAFKLLLNFESSRSVEQSVSDDNSRTESPNKRLPSSLKVPPLPVAQASISSQLTELRSLLPQKVAERAEFSIADVKEDLIRVQLHLDGVRVPQVDLVFEKSAGAYRKVGGEVPVFSPNFNPTYPPVSSLRIERAMRDQYRERNEKIISVRFRERLWLQPRGAAEPIPVMSFYVQSEKHGARSREHWQVSIPDAQVVGRRSAFRQ